MRRAAGGAALLAAALAGGRAMVRPRVLVVGATHGNELTGPWVARRLRGRAPAAVELQELVGNPKAHAACLRFVDEDLNRQFRPVDLANEGLTGYEEQRAKVVAPKCAEADFVVDLHTSTASMGVSLIVERFSDLGLACAAWCQRLLQPKVESGELPPVRIVRETMAREDCGHLIAAAPDGLLLEVGPVPQGVLRHDVCRWTEEAALAVLQFLAARAEGRELSLPQRVTVFEDLGRKVPLPQDEQGRPLAVFHADFQGRDFELLRKGDTIFEDIEGRAIAYDGAHGDEIWPVFVNEGAYYHPKSGLGFGVTLKKELDVPRI